MSDTPSRAENKADSFAARRVDLMYGFARRYAALPFAVFCLAIVLLADDAGVWSFLPLALMLAITGCGILLDRAFRRLGGEARLWERYFIVLSAFAGAAWGIGVAFWFVPGNFPAQACLCLAYMGMTAVEFFARATCRRAYFVHAALSVGPLMFRLLMGPSVEHIVAAAILFCFVAVLMGFGQSFTELVFSGIRSDLANEDLEAQLAGERTARAEAREAAAAAARQKDDFLATISHEMRTSLNALLGMSQMLGCDDLNPAARYHVRTIQDACSGFKTLLDDVVVMADDGAADDPRHECDPVAAARAVAHLLMPVAWEKRLHLTLTVSGTPSRIVLGPYRLRQALLKLAENGLKFTNSGSVAIRIEPVSREGRPFVRFSVSDTGPGVPPEMSAGLFQMRPAGDAGSRFVRPRGGAGFGLVVVRRIVEAAGGTYGFDSNLGEGACFWFTVPAAVADGGDAATLPPPKVAAVPPPTGMRLIVCMQDAAAHSELAGMLEPSGNKLIIARSPVDLVGRAGRGGFDAAIVRADLADMLAAAPGVKLPILALTVSDEPPPAAATAHLPWPCAPGYIYIALSEMHDPAPAAAEPAEADPLDGAALAALENSVGRDTLTEILKSYLENAEKICTGLKDAAANGGWEQAEGSARDIVGSASGLGLSAVTRRARELSSAVRERADDEALRRGVETVLAEEERTRKALFVRYPELKA